MKIVSSSVAIPRSRSKTRIAIETPHPRNSGPRYFALARSDHGFVRAITSAVSARYDAMNSTTNSLITSTGSNCTGPRRIQSRAPFTSWPNNASARNSAIVPKIQMYLYAARTR
jgi:hypothetical protein